MRITAVRSLSNAVAIGKGNNLYYADEAKGVFECVGASSCALFASGFKESAVLNFDAGWTHLWVTDIKTTIINAISPTTGKVLSNTNEHGGATEHATGSAAAPGPTY
jgi:hypothetical protein